MQVRYDMVQCFVVRRSPAEFLQLLRSPGRYMAGTWQIVSGGIEAGETAHAAALRELREETGLAPLEFYRLPSISSFYIVHQDAIYHCPAFCAIVADDARVVLNTEHTDQRWVARQHIDQALTWAGERVLAAELCREILDGGPAKPHLRIASAS